MVETKSFSIPIVADGDDGTYSSLGGLGISGEGGTGINYVGSWAGDARWSFVRFTLPSPIPAGVTVSSHTKLRLYLKNALNWSPPKSIVIVAELSADAPQVNDPASVSCVKTAASVVWTPEGAPTDSMFDTPDLSPLIQELVDTYRGLPAGAHIQFWMTGAGGYSDNLWAFEDFSLATGNEASLELAFACPAGFNNVAAKQYSRGDEAGDPQTGVAADAVDNEIQLDGQGSEYGRDFKEYAKPPAADDFDGLNDPNENENSLAVDGPAVPQYSHPYR